MHQRANAAGVGARWYSHDSSVDEVSEIHKFRLGEKASDTKYVDSGTVPGHVLNQFAMDEWLLAVPMTICEGGGDGVNGHDLAFSGLLVYDVDVERGFTRLGGIDHGTKGVACETWWSNANSAVKRSVFLDDLVYSIAMDRVKVQRMGNFGLDVAGLSLYP